MSSTLSPLLLFILPFLLYLPSPSSPKSTIEPCSGSDSCTALLGYTLYTDLKVSELASLFNSDPVAILAANSLDASVPDVDNHILPSALFLRVPVSCSCADGIRKSVSTRYRARPADTLASIATSVYSGLVSAEQIRDANGISDPDAIEAGQTLIIPLPCTCFNGLDNNLPAVYLSYVVRSGDTVKAIAARYATTVADIMDVNAMGSPFVNPGDIIAVPLPACASAFPRFASDRGLIVANGSYSITASHCVQCSCGPGNLNLYCTPASFAVSCSSMQCRNSNLTLGNSTSQPTSAGCHVTSCDYIGFVNGTILTRLSDSLQPQCPAQHQSPQLIQPPSALPSDSFPAPSPTPFLSQLGGTIMPPRTPGPGTLTFPGVSPANGPSGSVSAATSILSLTNFFRNVMVLCMFNFLW